MSLETVVDLPQVGNPVSRLGPCTFPTPLAARVAEAALLDDSASIELPGSPGPVLFRTGPRRLLHFDPKTVTAAICTCGGTRWGRHPPTRAR